MNNLYFFLCSLLMCVSVYIKADDSDFVNMAIQNVMECLSELPANFSMDTCHEMFADKNDNSLAKYDSCKCLAGCTSKKMGLINDDDTGNKEKLTSFVDKLNGELWKKEGQTILKHCSEATGTGCELAYNFMRCSMEHSKPLYNFLKNFIAGMSNTE